MQRIELHVQMYLHQLTFTNERKHYAIFKDINRVD